MILSSLRRTTHCRGMSMLFAALCRVMAPFTDQVTISFLDEYRGMRQSGLHAPSNEEMERFASFAGETAALAGLSVRACSEKGDYSRYGILPASCIDEKAAVRSCRRTFETVA